MSGSLCPNGRQRGPPQPDSSFVCCYVSKAGTDTVTTTVRVKKETAGFECADFLEISARGHNPSLQSGYLSAFLNADDTHSVLSRKPFSTNYFSVTKVQHLCVFSQLWRFCPYASEEFSSPLLQEITAACSQMTHKPHFTRPAQAMAIFFTQSGRYRKMISRELLLQLAISSQKSKTILC